MGTPVIQAILQDGLAAVVAKGRLPFHVANTAILLAACRTGSLGHTIYRCSESPLGHEIQYRPNSCGNRFCRTCASTRIEKRIRHESEHFLKADHHQLVLTLPPELRVFWRLNGKLVGDLLLRSTSTSVIRLLAKDRYMGGRPGIVSFLHTWNQRMEAHPHVHMLVSSVGLSSRGEVVKATMEHLLPNDLLSAHWRSTFINMLRDALRRHPDDIEFPVGMNVDSLRLLLATLSKKYWHAHAMPATSSKHSLKYNVAYSTGGCIGNRRVVKYDGINVLIQARTPKSRAEKVGPVEHVQLTRDEFIERLLSHVPAYHQRVIGHYGLYANPATNKKLAALRTQLGMAPVVRTPLTVRDLMDVFKHSKPSCCASCGSRMVPSERLSTGPPTLETIGLAA